jgi:hypothetical protein
MSEDLVIDLGKDVYQMMSDKEKRYLTYFVWAGCGCHKDLNSVRSGYFAMSKWWEKHKQTPPILLANRDNAAVLADMVSDSNVTSVTPRRTPTDSERDFGNGLNHYPHFTSFPFPISSRVLSQLLIHNLPSLLPYLRIVTAASAAELLPSINT